jgi:hypothetical protein
VNETCLIPGSAKTAEPAGRATMPGAWCPSAGSEIAPARTLADPPLWVNDLPYLKVRCTDAGGTLTAHLACAGRGAVFTLFLPDHSRTA